MSEKTENTGKRRDSARSDSATRGASQSSQEQPQAQQAQSQSTPLFLAPRRRRAGRRVVRAAGAAGAQHIAVHVAEPEHEEPHAEENRDVIEEIEMPAARPRRRRTRRMSLSDIRLPERGSSAPSPHSDSDSASSSDSAPDPDAPSSSRSSRKSTASRTSSTKPAARRAAKPSAASAQSRRSKTDDSASAADFAARTADAERCARTAAIAAELFSDKGVSEPRPKAAASEAAARPSRHPMASLLFQAPDLSAQNAEQPEEDEQPADAEEQSGPRSRRRRRSRSHAHRTAADRRDERAEEDADSASETDGTSDRAERAGSSSRSRRRRSRMNASERAAAAEVKFIEDDIARDAVRAEAMSSDENSDEANGQQGGSRRIETRDGLRLRRRVRRHSSSASSSESVRSPRTGRSAVSERTAIAARPAAGTRRQREKAYIAKIKDVSGSTRLEAKRRRRRETRRDRTRQSFLLEQEDMARREHVDRQMIVRERGRHTQISVIEDNILVEHYVSDIDEVSTVGNIYVGRVQNVLPGMEAAFVNIGEARNGVLYSGEVNWDAARLEGKPQRIELAYHSGDPIMVQVTKDPIGHKGARLTAQITLAGRYIVLVPSGAMTGVSRKLPERERTRLRQIVSRLTPKNMGVIIRTAADGASEEALEKDFDTLLTRWKNVQDRYNEFKDTHRPHILHREPDVAIRVVRDIFNDDFRRLVVEGDSVYRRIRDYLEEMSPDQLDKLERWDPEEHHGADVFDEWKIDSQLRKGMERKVYLPSGGSLVIDRTEAMTTIDVNTGRFVGKGKSLEEIVTRVNLEAAEEIVRQLRLRDIGGMIMIDFVDMVMAENRDLVLRRLIECLSRDRTKHQVAEVTSLGLVQMTRKRVGQGLVEAFSQECPMCHGRGFIIHDDPTIEINAADPYEAKGGDPFEKSSDARREVHRSDREEYDAEAPKGSSADVRRKLAQIAAAATREDETSGHAGSPASSASAAQE